MAVVVKVIAAEYLAPTREMEETVRTGNQVESENPLPDNPGL